MEAAAPYAADHGVWMGVEIHSPYSFADEWIKRHLEVASRVGPDVVGCVPDMGIFVHRLPRVVVERALRDGADPDLVERITQTYDSHGDTQGLFERLQAAGTDPVTLGLARTGTQMIAQPVSCLREHAELDTPHSRAGSLPQVFP